MKSIYYMIISIACTIGMTACSISGKQPPKTDEAQALLKALKTVPL